MAKKILENGWLLAAWILLAECLTSALSGLASDVFDAAILQKSALFLCSLLLFRQAGLSLPSYCGFRRIPARRWPGLLLILVCSIVACLYLNAVSSALISSGQTGVLLQMSWEHPVKTILGYAILPALTEEMLFRGMLCRAIPEKKRAVLLSALAFAAFHADFSQFCYAFFMGILFGGLFLLTENLSVTAVLHFLFNLYNIIFAWTVRQDGMREIIRRIRIGGYRLLDPQLINDDGRLQGMQLAIGGTVAAAAVGIIVFYCIRARRRESP